MKTIPGPTLLDLNRSNKLSGEDHLLALFIYSSEEEMHLFAHVSGDDSSRQHSWNEYYQKITV